MIGYDYSYNGVSFSDIGLPDINYFHLTNVDYDNLDVRNEIVERSQYHGAFLGAVLASTRVITIEGEIISENRTQRGILTDQLRNTFPLNPSPSFENLNMKEFSFKRDADGQLIKVNAMVVKPIEFEDDLDNDKNITKFRVELLCNDIAFKGELFTLNSVENFNHGTTLLPLGGANTKTTLPASLSTKNSININYTGTFASPLYIKITGSSLNPQILNTITEKFFKLNLEIEEGDYIIIDTENSQVLDSSGNSLNKYIENGSQWLFLQSGNNVFVFSDDTSPILNPADIEIQYYNKYT